MGKQEENIAGFVVGKKVIPAENGLRQKDGISTLEINPLEDIPIERIKNELRNLIECYEKTLQQS